MIFSLSLKGAFPGLALGPSDVPKIIHQSWKTTQLREDHEVWQQSWFDANPGWKYMFWTDLDNRQLVADFYPDLLYTYDILPKNISRADFVRALYMHKYGGVYADLDTWCLRPVDTLLTAGPGIAYVAEMGPDLTYAHNIPNAWYASSPGHPFWLFFVERVVELTQNVVDGRRDWPGIEEIAGPVMLKAALDVGIWTRSDARSLTRSLAHSLTRSLAHSLLLSFASHGTTSIRSSAWTPRWKRSSTAGSTCSTGMPTTSRTLGRCLPKPGTNDSRTNAPERLCTRKRCSKRAKRPSRTRSSSPTGRTRGSGGRCQVFYRQV